MRAVSGNRPLIVIGVVLMVALITTAVLVAVRRPGDFAPGTPEATVQDFIRAVFDEDYDEAVGHLEPTRKCRASELVGRGRAGDRAALRDVDLDGDEATVTVEFTESSTDPFDRYEWSYQEFFELRRDGDTWFIEQQSWLFLECMGT